MDEPSLRSDSLEAWLLEGHRAFSRVPGLKGIDLRRWLSDSGLWPYGAPQPDQPRHAMERLFAEFRPHCQQQIIEKLRRIIPSVWTMLSPNLCAPACGHYMTGSCRKPRRTTCELSRRLMT